jgi:hypothetical protein
MLGDVGMIGGTEVLPPLAAAKGLYIAAMRAHQKILRVHAGHGLVHLVEELTVERVMRLIPVAEALQGCSQLQAAPEGFLFNGFLERRFSYSLRISAEKFEIFTIVVCDSDSLG